MKKVSFKIFFVSFLLLVAVCLSSCAFLPFLMSDVPAEWRKISKQMNKWASYEASMTLDMNTRIGGSKVDITIERKMIECNVGGKDYYFYQNTKTSTGNIGSSETTEAYYNGNMFISSKVGAMTGQKIYTPMTLKEYKEYRSRFGGAGINFSGCGKSEVAETEDGKIEITFSEFSEKAIESMMESLGFDGSIDIDVNGLDAKIYADEKYNVEKIEMIFDVSGTSSLEITIKYSKINEATPKTKEFDTSQYVELDIRELIKLEDMLKERQNAKGGKFTLEMSQTVSGFGEKQSYSETDTVEYGIKDKKYFYDIKAEANDNEYDISYFDGTKTVAENGGSEKTEKQNDKEAKAFIDGLINSALYTTSSVTSFTKNGDEYVLDCSGASPFSYSAVFSPIGATPQLVQQTVRITVKNGDIVKIVSDAEVTGRVNYQNHSFAIVLDLDTTVTFE